MATLKDIRLGTTFKENETDTHYYVKGEYDASHRRHHCKAYTSKTHKPYRHMDRHFKGSKNILKYARVTEMETKKPMGFYA